MNDFSPQKFTDPDWTAGGERRASVALTHLDTLWINTGTLCNIACTHCYIESTPTNDRLVYITRDEARAYLDELARDGWNTREIAFTGGEPFINPDMIAMAQDALSRGHEVLILTNAMQPMQRPRVQSGLRDLRDAYGDRLTLRVSLDHYGAALHDLERGSGTWLKTVEGLDWLAQENFRVAIAGRTMWDETIESLRQGYAALARERGWPVDTDSPASLVLFPEMDERAQVPEITTRCWSILNKRPDSVMCASSRMVVKRKGAAVPVVLPCTLLPYDLAFEMGATLADSTNANGGMFADGAVKLCHPHCAKFCVLGGASCSG